MAFLCVKDKKVLEQLEAEGIIPRECRNVRVNMAIGEPVTVTCEYYVTCENLHRIIDAVTSDKPDDWYTTK